MPISSKAMQSELVSCLAALGRTPDQKLDTKKARRVKETESNVGGIHEITLTFSNSFLPSYKPGEYDDTHKIIMDRIVHERLPKFIHDSGIPFNMSDFVFIYERGVNIQTQRQAFFNSPYDNKYAIVFPADSVSPARDLGDLNMLRYTYSLGVFRSITTRLCVEQSGDKFESRINSTPIDIQLLEDYAFNATMHEIGHLAHSKTSPNVFEYLKAYKVLPSDKTVQTAIQTSLGQYCSEAGGLEVVAETYSLLAYEQSLRKPCSLPTNLTDLYLNLGGPNEVVPFDRIRSWLNNQEKESVLHSFLDLPDEKSIRSAINGYYSTLSSEEFKDNLTKMNFVIEAFITKATPDVVGPSGATAPPKTVNSGITENPSTKAEKEDELTPIPTSSRKHHSRKDSVLTNISAVKAKEDAAHQGDAHPKKQAHNRASQHPKNASLETAINGQPLNSAPPQKGGRR